MTRPALLLFVLLLTFPARAADPLVPWAGNVTVRPVSPEVADRHTIHAYYVANPESPDGRHVLFFASTHAAGHEGGEIVVRDRATGAERVLARNVTTEDAHRAACQQWVSNGRRVAFHDCRDGVWVVCVVDVATGQETVVARERQLGFASPTADVLPVYGYHWKTTDARDVELVDLTTGKTTTAVTAAATRDKYPDFINKRFGERPMTLFFPVLSPDASRLFYKLATAGDGNFRSKAASTRLGLVVYDLAKRDFLMLRADWGHPAWAADSRTVIEPGGMIIDTNDGASRRIPGPLPKFRGDHPSFSPDQQLVVTDTTMDAFAGDVKHWGIVLRRASDGKLHTIHTADNSRGARSWRVSHPHPAFSADGKRIYFNQSSDGWTRLMVAEPAPN